MSQLFGNLLDESKELNDAIEKVVNLASGFGKSIQKIKPGESSQLESGKKQVEELAENRGRPLFFPFIGSGVGNGCYVESVDGAIKLDLINGIGINIMGHSHPEVMKAAVKGAIKDVVMQGNLQPGGEMLQLSRKLVEIASRKSRLKHSWLTTSGSMANENALKMCRQKMNAARKIIAMDAAFAGRTTLMAEITDNATMRVGLPEYGEVLRVPFFDATNPNSIEISRKILEQHINGHKGDICAFMFEPMQGEGGYKAAPREFFIPLFELCRQHKIPIWADEIQTFCRTGEFFAYEKLNLGEYIDICTVAKTLQGAATLYTEELNPQPGLIAGTFSGSSAAMSAGLSILNILDENKYMGPNGRIEEIHTKFVGMLNELNKGSCKGLLQDAGGLGLMVGVTPLDGTRESMIKIVNKLYENGLICFGCGRGPYRIRFLIPAVIKDADIDVIKSILEKSILELV